MKYALYVFIGLLVFMVVHFVSLNFGNDFGVIASAISMLCAVIVICTLILADAIKSTHKGN